MGGPQLFQRPWATPGIFPTGSPQCGISTLYPRVPGSTLPVVGWPVSSVCGWRLVGELKDSLGPKQGRVRVGPGGSLEPSLLRLYQLRWGRGPESTKGVLVHPDQQGSTDRLKGQAAGGSVSLNPGTSRYYPGLPPGAMGKWHQVGRSLSGVTPRLHLGSALFWTWAQTVIRSGGPWTSSSQVSGEADYFSVGKRSSITATKLKPGAPAY